MRSASSDWLTPSAAATRIELIWPGSSSSSWAAAVANPA
jgi:hypothetical protein